jgi:hypothetical protein
MTLLNDPKTFRNDHYVNIRVHINHSVVFNAIHPFPLYNYLAIF